jgi:hypothetical protein
VKSRQLGKDANHRGSQRGRGINEDHSSKVVLLSLRMFVALQQQRRLLFYKDIPRRPINWREYMLD